MGPFYDGHHVASPGSENGRLQQRPIFLAQSDTATRRREAMHDRRAFLLTAGLAALILAVAVLWAAATFAQVAPDGMAKAVKADDIKWKWEPLGDSGVEISI